MYRDMFNVSYILYFFLILISLGASRIKKKGNIISFTINLISVLAITYFLFYKNYILLDDFHSKGHTNIFSLILGIITFIIILLNGYKNKEKIYRNMLYSISLFFSLNLLFLNNFLLIFIYLESLLIMRIVLSFWYGNKEIKLVAIRYLFSYFILSLVLLTSVILFYLSTKSFRLDTIDIINYDIYKLSVSLLLFGALFIFGIFPCGFSFPEIYKNSNTENLLGISLIVDSSLIYFTIIILKNMLSYLDNNLYYILQNLILFCSLITILYGCMMAYFQENIKSIVSYTYLVHMCCLINIIFSQSYDYKLYVILYVIISPLTLIGFYSFLDLFYNNVDILRGLVYRNLGYAIYYIMFILSLVGFPLTSNFFIKYYIFMNYLKDNLFYHSFILGTGTILCMFFYIKLIKISFSRSKKIYNNIEPLKCNIKTHLFLLFSFLVGIIYPIFLL